MDQCGANIDPDVGKTLIGVQVPENVKESWKEASLVAKSTSIANMVLVNASGAPDFGATLIHQIGTVQIAGFFRNPAILAQHPELHKTINAVEIEKILAPLSRSEHFCVIHLDFEAGKAKIFRSFDVAGPGIAVIHVDKGGEGSYSEGLGSLYHNNRESWIHTESIRPADVIIGMSEEYVSTVSRGFSSGILDSMCYLYNLDCVENVVSDVIQIAVPKKAHHILVGVVPELIQERLVKEEKLVKEER
jgi:hypothetical protein